jgi:hypothetical protein
MIWHLNFLKRKNKKCINRLITIETSNLFNQFNRPVTPAIFIYKKWKVYI